MKLLYGLSASIASMLWTAGCPYGTPDKSTVIKIEKWASSQPCIGPLNRWARHYSYQLRGHPNKRFISVQFVEAGHNGIPAGQYIEEPGFSGIDDSQGKGAAGEYEIATGKLHDWGCQWNMIPAGRDDYAWRPGDW